MLFVKKNINKKKKILSNVDKEEDFKVILDWCCKKKNIFNQDTTKKKDNSKDI